MNQVPTWLIDASRNDPIAAHVLRYSQIYGYSQEVVEQMAKLLLEENGRLRSELEKSIANQQPVFFLPPTR